MTVTRDELQDLHDRLIEVLGEGPADTLMELLPPPHRVDVDAYREELGEIGASLIAVGVTSHRARREISDRNDSIRDAHSAGASIQQLVESSKLEPSAVADILETNASA